MLTPLDIHNKVFIKGMRGYKMEEVDEFLDEVIRNYESLFRENHELKERVKRMEEEVERSKGLEESLQKTMLMAQKLVDDESLRAKKEGELIIWEAQKKGQQFINEANEQVILIKQEIERLKLFEKQLYLKHKGFLEFQMELLDGYKESPDLPEIAKDQTTANIDLNENNISIDEIETSDNNQIEGQDSVEQVYLMAQKMEEALKNLDTIYSVDDHAEEQEQE